MDRKVLIVLSTGSCGYDFVCPPTTQFDPSRNVCVLGDNSGHVTHTEAPVTQTVHTDGPHTEAHTEGHHTEGHHTEGHTETHQTDAPHTEATHTQAPHTEPTHATPSPNPDQTTRGRHGGF